MSTAMNAGVTMGERISRLREGHGWTQKRFAEQVGLSVAFVSDLENDKRNPSTAVLLRIAEALGSSMDYLATGRAHDQAQEHQALTIPAELAAAAELKAWSLGHTADLLKAYQMVTARRSKQGRSPRGLMSVDDWVEFSSRLFSDDET